MPRRCLRIVSVNDVYSLENLPRLKTLVAHVRRTFPDDALVVALAGDFLAPSLLSSIDAGRGMVDCLNDVGVTHVILGNHEDDVSGEDLRRRLRELSAVCIGTNVRAGLELPRHVVVEVGDARVGIVGVVMDDPAVYRGEPFGGVDLAPANDAAVEETERLFGGGCDAVVALTHQPMKDDRALAARAPRLAAIIGGHEHTPILEQVGSTWIVKTGAEAERAAITEIVWRAGAALDAPRVTVRLEEVAGYAEDAALRARVDHHMARVRDLERATLLRLPPGERLSSVGTRSRQTSIGTLVCSKLRDALEAEAGLFNGGGIRASREYEERFTYADIQAEVPFDNEVVVVRLPGRVIAEAIASSRANAPAESGAFLQVDDEMLVDDAHAVVSIAGAPLDPERHYDVAIVRELLFGLDQIEPLVRWAADHPASAPPLGRGREAKMLLFEAFARGIWQELGGFDAIDLDGDERVTRAEIAAAVARMHPTQPPSSVLADLLLRTVDLDGDRVISREEADVIEARERRPAVALLPTDGEE